MTTKIEIPNAGEGHTITARFAGILKFGWIADLPVHNLKFSRVLNGVGPWESSLNVEDQGVKEAAWIAATAPNLSTMWVDIDGVPKYGGRSLTRNHQWRPGTVAIGGTDFCGYLQQRLQARDYDEYTDPEGHRWYESTQIGGGAAAIRIAYYLLQQGMEKAGSIPIKIVAEGDAGSEFFVCVSMPITQQQTLAALLSQLSEMSYMVGVDYACDVKYTESGAPEALITLSYPVRGEGSAEDPLVIDMDSALEVSWPEEGGEQADRIVEMSGATIERTGQGIYLPAQLAGYPLLEATITHSSMAPAEESAAVLEAFVSGALSVRAFPPTTPSITLPLFGEPSIHDLDVGQYVKVISGRNAGEGPPTNPRFPEGLEQVFRIVRIDVEVPDEGVPRMVLTLNLPPGAEPVEPPYIPGITGESSGATPEEGGPGEPPITPETPGETTEEREAREKAETETREREEAERTAKLKEEEEAFAKQYEEEQKKREADERKEKEELEKQKANEENVEKHLHEKGLEEIGGITKGNLKPEAEKEGIGGLKPGEEYGALETLFERSISGTESGSAEASTEAQEQTCECLIAVSVEALAEDGLEVKGRVAASINGVGAKAVIMNAIFANAKKGELAAAAAMTLILPAGATIKVAMEGEGPWSSGQTGVKLIATVQYLSLG